MLNTETIIIILEDAQLYGGQPTQNPMSFENFIISLRAEKKEEACKQTIKL